MMTKYPKATKSQILAIASKFDAIGFNGQSVYAVSSKGTEVEKKTVFAVSIYRDSFSSLMKSGNLKYNEDFTYSVV
jgi:hypothetical protein